MPTVAEQLQFVVRFVQMDLATLQPGEWGDLRHDLYTFFWGKPGEELPRFSLGHVMITPLGLPPPQDFPEGNFRDLQAETRYILYGMLGLRDWRASSDPGHFRQKPGPIVAQYGLLPLDTSGIPGRNILHATGATRDMFLLALFFLLGHEPTERILRCPECSTIFYRIRKQQYCSRTCTNRANVRHWRQGEHGQQQEAEHARQR